MKDKKIKDWKKLTDEITKQWIVDYFELSDDSEVSYWWIADNVGTVFEFADYFFDFNTVLKCYELNVSREDLFKWYYWSLKNHSVNISLSTFILSPKERELAEQIHLEELEARVKSAEKLKTRRIK